jgi:hypothetical protein
MMALKDTVIALCTGFVIIFGAIFLIYITYIHDVLWALPILGLVVSIITTVLILFTRFKFETINNNFNGGDGK